MLILVFFGNVCNGNDSDIRIVKVSVDDVFLKVILIFFDKYVVEKIDGL